MGPTAAGSVLLAGFFLALLRLGTALESCGSGTDARIAAGQAGPAGSGAGSCANGEAGAAAADDCVRCRLSGICDSPPHTCHGTTAAGSSEDSPDVYDAYLACLWTDEQRAAAVQEAARHAWSGYRDCAWGEDELQPLTCSGVHWLNLSLTMVDSLDTLHLLGLHKEFEEAAEWLVTHLDVGAPAAVNLFETTIRVMGGLLSAQALTAATHPALSLRLAEKAAELGARLMPAFQQSPSGVPYSDVNLRTGEASPPSWGHISSLAEMCSVSLEFTYLARITGHIPFEEVPLKVHELLESHTSAGGGLLGMYFDPLTGKAHKEHSGTITLGARADSYYEYLLKQWLLTGKTEGWLRERYVQAMRSVRSRLLQRTAPPGQPGLWYVAEQLRGGQLSGKMDHLVCFLPGLLALGDFHNVSTRHSDPYGMKPEPRSSSGGSGSGGTGAGAAGEAGAHGADDPAAAAGVGGGAVSVEEMGDLALAHELALSCYELYRRTPAGLAPEIVHFANNSELQEFPNKHVHDVGHGDFSIKPNDAHNLLRPESVESFYLLWKVTGHPRYKQWAWQVFRAFEKWTRVRPADRQDACSSCLADAALQATQRAKAAADAAGATGGAGAASQQQQRYVAAAAQALQQQLRGGEVCASCSHTGGYTSLESVLAVPPARRNKMESFFLAETLKYLYLIFTEPPDKCLHPSCQPGAAGAAGATERAGEEERAGRQQQGQQGLQGMQQQQEQQQHGHQQRQEGQQQHQTGQRGQRQARLPLDRFVFTTEAHPLPIVGSNIASAVARVLDPNSPLLRPFGDGQCAAGAGGNGGGGRVQQAAARAAAAVKAAVKVRRRGTAVPGSGSGSGVRLIEAALEDVLQRLTEAAAAITGQPRLPHDAGGGDAARTVLSDEGAAAAAAAAAAAEEEDPYETETAEEEDPYETETAEEEDPYDVETAEEEEDDPYEHPDVVEAAEQQQERQQRQRQGG